MPEPILAEPGTAIKTAAPEALSRAHDEREAVDMAIVFGAPSSLAASRALMDAASALKPEETGALATISRGIEAIIYPVFLEDGTDAKPIVGEAPAGTPAPIATVLRLLSDAARGKASPVPAEIAGTALGELVPALALVNASSNDATRLALEALDRFARIGASSILPDYLRGLEAERRSDWEAAVLRYSAALTEAADAWSARLGLCRCLLSLGRNREALSAIESLASERSGSREFDRPFAIALYQNARFEDAAPFVLRILTHDPQDAELLLMRAHLLVRARSYQQALPLLDAYGTVDPGSRSFLLLRCLAAEGLKSREEALKWARRGLSAYPDDPEMIVAAARILFSGNAAAKEEARLMAQKAFDLTARDRPSSASGSGGESASDGNAASRAAAGVEAARLLALDASTRYRWDEASSYLERALAFGGFDDKALAASILRKAKKPQAALEYASAWYRDAPDSDPAAEAYLRSLIDSGNERAAQDLISRLLPSADAPAFRSTLYYLQSKLQNSDDAALALLRSALIENADSPEALAAVYDIQIRRKDYAKARFYLKQAIALAPGDPELERRQRELEAAAP